MKLGLVAFALIPSWRSAASSRKFIASGFAPPIRPTSQRFFIIAIFYVVAFTALATAALAARKNPAAHKRLILLATTIIVGAAYARWWGRPLYHLFGDGFGGMLINTYAGTSILLVAAARHMIG